VRWKLAIAVACAAARAHAAPDDVIIRPLVLDDGAIELRLTAELGVQRAVFARPLSLAPDAWWGIWPRWTLGVIHSSASLDRIDAGATLCVRQVKAPPCDQLYHGGGLDVRYGALAGPLAVAPHLRLIIRDFDPIKPAATIGATLRWAYSRFAIASDPYLRLPLANAELGNRTQVVLPLWLTVQPATGWAISLHLGYDSDLAVFRDGGHGPVGLGVTARATAAVDVAVEAGWAELLGPQHDAKHGAIMISADWHR
jgi:hypothetical protein